MERIWVLASNKHRQDDLLQFWGSYTPDEEERSYGGYYTDFDKCEKYTTEEKETGFGSHYPTLDSNSGAYKLCSTEHFWIKISELEKLSTLKKKTVYKFC